MQRRRAGEAESGATDVEADPALIAITSGSSRDHREDLTPWMLALVTTHDGEIPLFVQPLSGKSRDTVRVLAAVHALQEHWRATDEAPQVSVADNGICSDAKMRELNQTHLIWISRVSETSTRAKQALAARSETWQTTDDGRMHFDSRVLSMPQGQERGVMVRTNASEQRSQASLQRHVKRALAEREKTCWHLGNRRFAWETDARAALSREKMGKPAWLDLQTHVVAHAQHEGPGRPRTDARPLKES
jgi:transposase